MEYAKYIQNRIITAWRERHGQINRETTGKNSSSSPSPNPEEHENLQNNNNAVNDSIAIDINQVINIMSTFVNNLNRVTNSINNSISTPTGMYNNNNIINDINGAVDNVNKSIEILNGLLTHQTNTIPTAVNPDNWIILESFGGGIIVGGFIVGGYFVCSHYFPSQGLWLWAVDKIIIGGWHLAETKYRLWLDGQSIPVRKVLEILEVIVGFIAACANSIFNELPDHEF